MNVDVEESAKQNFLDAESLAWALYKAVYKTFWSTLRIQG